MQIFQWGTNWSSNKTEDSKLRMGKQKRDIGSDVETEENGEREWIRKKHRHPDCFGQISAADCITVQGALIMKIGFAWTQPPSTSFPTFSVYNCRLHSYLWMMIIYKKSEKHGITINKTKQNITNILMGRRKRHLSLTRKFGRLHVHITIK